VKPTPPFSGASSVRSGARGTRDLAAVRCSNTSTGSPLIKSVNVEEKKRCCKDGARKPLDTEPRRVKSSVALNAKAILPSMVEPKSL
jgi:hypothetical protein